MSGNDEVGFRRWDRFATAAATGDRARPESLRGRFKKGPLVGPFLLPSRIGQTCVFGRCTGVSASCRLPAAALPDRAIS